MFSANQSNEELAAPGGPCTKAANDAASRRPVTMAHRLAVWSGVVFAALVLVCLLLLLLFLACRCRREKSSYEPSKAVAQSRDKTPQREFYV